ncbi:MAG: hypothetical protein ACRDHM_10650 [Actinomycetota bacterium]
MHPAPSRLCATTLGLLLGAGCAGDPGADQGLPACNARPVDPPGYESVRTEEVEASDHSGHVYEYRGTQGEQVAFYYGVATDAAQGLPQVGQLPLASVGGGRLLGRGGEWAFVWNDQFPCDPMTVAGTGFTKKTFTQVLSVAHVTAFEEEEGEAGGGEGIAEGVGGESEEEEIEGLPQAGGPVSEFVAVFESAPNPNDLEQIQQELLDEAPRNIAVAPASCWKGLPPSLGVSRNTYVAAVVATTGNELDFVIERVDRVPIFYGQLTARCVD